MITMSLTNIAQWAPKMTAQSLSYWKLLRTVLLMLFQPYHLCLSTGWSSYFSVLVFVLPHRGTIETVVGDLLVISTEWMPNTGAAPDRHRLWLQSTAVVGSLSSALMLQALEGGDWSRLTFKCPQFLLLVCDPTQFHPLEVWTGPVIWCDLAFPIGALMKQKGRDLADVAESVPPVSCLKFRNRELTLKDLKSIRWALWKRYHGQGGESMLRVAGPRWPLCSTCWLTSESRGPSSTTTSNWILPSPWDKISGQVSFWLHPYNIPRTPCPVSECMELVTHAWFFYLRQSSLQ